MFSLCLLTHFFLLISGVDIVFESVKRIRDTNPDACDNFYRHTCPFGTKNLNEMHMLKEIKERVRLHHDQPWNQFEFFNDFKNYNGLLYAGDMYNATQNLPSYGIMSIAQLVNKRCDSKTATQPFFRHFQKLVTFNGNSSSISTLRQFADCDDESLLAIGDELRIFSRLFKEKYPRYYKVTISILESSDLTEFLIRAQNTLRKRRAQMTGARMMKVDEKISKGVAIVANVVEEMKEVAIDWLEDTKWVQHNQAVEHLQDITRKIRFYKDFDKVITETDKLFKDIEESYTSCKHDNGVVDQLIKTFCLLAAFVENPFEEYRHYKDARNVPIIFDHQGYGGRVLYFAFDLFLAAASIEEEAGMIGVMGALAGHEVGHTLDKIRVNWEFRQMPVFSEIARKCATKLYEDACKEFKEKTCMYDVVQDGEITADILGYQLSYQVFKNHYGDRAQEIYPKLNITYEQLFFHGTSVQWCEHYKAEQWIEKGRIGQHPARNLRANVVAQIPAFEIAFNCPPDSRMALLSKEECHMYGPNAPETRRWRDKKIDYN